MQITQKQCGAVTIVRLSGTMTLGEGDEMLKDKIKALVAEGNKNILLDMGDCPYIDSAGLGEIVRSFTMLSRQGGKLKLLDIRKQIEGLLKITKLDTLYEVFTDEATAIKSFD